MSDLAVRIAGIRARDAASVTYSDGTIHCGEGGDNVALDRRALLQTLDYLKNALAAWREEVGPESRDDDILHAKIDEVCGR